LFPFYLVVSAVSWHQEKTGGAELDRDAPAITDQHSLCIMVCTILPQQRALGRCLPDQPDAVTERTWGKRICFNIGISWSAL